MKANKVMLVLLMLLTTYGVAAQSSNEQQTEEKRQAEEREKILEKRGTCERMTVKLLEAKYRPTHILVETLQGLLSRDGKISQNQALKTITVRDCAWNLPVIEQALAKLDVPEQSPANMEFQLHLLAASAKPLEGGAAMPKALEPVLTQLKATLKYANYRYVYSAINRLTNGGKVESSGVTGELFPAPPQVANVPGNPSFYQYSLQNVKFTQDASGKDSVQIDYFKFGISVPLVIAASSSNVQYKDIGLVTPLSLREGELAVVGTANISGSDEAMIVVVSVKKLK